MAKKKTKKEVKKSFYDADDPFMDSEDDSYYDNSDDSDDYSLKNDSKHSIHKMFDFLWWELVVFGIEILLFVYFILVLLKIVPLF